MKPARIVSAQAIDDHNLIIKFTNNELKKYDISKLLDNPMFSPLKNPAFFRNFIIDSGGYALVWNEDIDISEYELWQNGISITNEKLISHFGIFHVE
ncbi:DUF2442 domain-containing protein [Dolichospermum circinale CS-537/01]|jgi:hypothetical protein|uniref:DUF2442 domain-containing protein n=1 Tax=Dolichospermum circinale CS-537/01 TaxID=3021739 RepID=A0ABT5AC21_9CYAN|nr:DUF2442 domain-containing protein [Dolichospermum circinale]MDB9488697.1 DUF2442 domain-containing protein [Dolichospermum circinale CS-537/01]